MRQWVNSCVFLFVVMVMAAFVLCSIVSMISASLALQQRIDAFDNLAAAESRNECDPFGSALCF